MIDYIFTFIKFWILGFSVTFGVIKLTEPAYSTDLGMALIGRCFIFWPFQLFFIILKAFT